MQTGWKQINGNWFYFNTSGEMKTGWGKINNNGIILIQQVICRLPSG